MTEQIRRCICPCVALAIASGCARTTRVDIGPMQVNWSMLVTTEWLADRLEDPSVVVVHVSKSRDVYEKGHIPGARFLGWDEIAADRDGILNEIRPVEDLVEVVRRLGIDESKRVVLYDEEFGVAAARGYVTLDYLGLGERAALLDGHLRKWKSEGRPLTTEEPDVRPSRFVPRRKSDVIIDYERMRDLVWATNPSGRPAVALIDARPAAQYRGDEGGKGVSRPGHIPGARSVHSKENIVSEEQPVLRPVADLRDLYARAGLERRVSVSPRGHTGSQSPLKRLFRRFVRRDEAPAFTEPPKRAVTYCRTGGQASLSYFTLKYLGHDVSLYDGSFSDWSARENAPVERGALTK